MTAARPPLLAVAMLSAASLGYELLLLRLFAIVQWHHFAYLAISVALLGFGSAGTLVTLWRSALVERFARSFALAAAGFALTAPACFALAQAAPFNPLELWWDPGAWLGLLRVYALLFLPFFCAATALCLAYARFAGDIAAIYGADIVGAAAGSLVLLGLLFVVPANEALRVIAAAGLLAGALAGAAQARSLAGILLLLALALPWWPAALPGLEPSPYKDLSQALSARGARVVAQRSGPLGSVVAVDSPQAPPHFAPGLSLSAAGGPPAQIALFVDGQAAGVVARFDGELAPFAYLRATTAAAPYVLLERPRVLVLGAGGAGDVLQAAVHGAATVDAVELDANVVAMVEQDLAGFSGRPYSLPQVRLHVADARGHVSESSERFDLIQLSLLEAFGSGVAGLGALAESGLYTVDALADYLARLRPGGILAFTRWLVLPPRDSLRLFATAVAALERRGGAPALSLAMIRSWSTATLLVRDGPFAASDIEALQAFCRRHSFDIVYAPGVGVEAGNRYNLLADDDFATGVRMLLGPRRDEFVERYKFSIAPVSDDRPYFGHFFKWRTLSEMLALRAAGAMPPIDWGYPVLIIALVQATVLSAALILLPLAAGRSRGALMAAPALLRRRLLPYFLLLGLAFMAVEMPLLQRFSLYLSHPAYAASVVLAAFLLFAGLGARHSARLAPAVRWPFAVAVVLVAAVAFGLSPLLAATMGWPLAAKLATTLLVVAPVAFVMGMPFPLGLRAVAAQAPALLPWAWGINGFASVLATMLATLAAVHLGYALVLAGAAGGYALAAALMPGQSPR